MNEAKQRIVMGEFRARRVFNSHSNDLGDWCPYSGDPAPGADDDERCPQGCRASAVEE